MNKLFKQANSFLILALFLALFLSCTGPITITGVPLRLLANFNTDAINTRPNADLPGDPAGDQILYRGGIVNPKIVPAGGNKWLSITNTRDGASHDGDRMIFRGTTATYPTNVYYTWKANIVTAFVNGSFTINLTDGAGNDNVRLRFADYRGVEGGVPLFGYLYLLPSREFLGKVPVNQNCSYSVSIDHQTNTFSLSVARPSFPDGNLSINNHPLAVNMSSGTKNPSIEIKNDTDPPEFQNGTTLANPTEGMLYLDDLMIQAN